MPQPHNTLRRITPKKSHLKRAATVALVSLFSLNLLITLAPLLQGRADAAVNGKDYMLYYADVDKDDIARAAHDGGIGDNDTNGVLSRTYLLSQGGRLGTVKLALDPKLSNTQDMPIYKLDYYCTPTNPGLNLGSSKPGDYTLSTTPPSGDKTYAKVSMRVGLGKNGNWSSVATDKAVHTYTGLSREQDGLFHSSTKNVKVNGSGDGYQQMAKTFAADHDTDLTDGEHTMYQNCMPQNAGVQYLDDTAVYANLSASEKADWDAAIKSAGLGDDSASISGNSGDGDTTLSCDSSGDLLSWFMCSIFNDVSKASDFMLNDIIQPNLRTQPLCLDPSGSTCEGGTNVMYSAWSNFRIYGNVFLVIALLVMIFGQTIGGGIVDAYTVKKVLPRLLIAVVLINLSIYIVALLVDITNILGGALGAALTAPLGDTGAFQIKPSTVQLGPIFAGGLIATALSAAAIGALFTTAGISMILVVLVVPAFLVIISIFVTIILRKALILGLVLVSPLAFAMYCLPNTEKYFKKWWDLLFEMLMIYPIIIVIFAIADVLSAITGGVGQTSHNPLNAILSFALLIIPLFMIPYSFKLAGNSLARLHGAVTGVAAKAGEMNKSRAERAKADYGRQVVTKRDALYNSQAATAIGNRRGGRYIMGRRREAVSQQVTNAGMEFAKTAGAQATQHDDDALRAGTYSGYNQAVNGVRDHLMRNDPNLNYEDATEQAQRSARAVQTSGGFSRARASWSAQQMAQTGTAYRDIEDVAQTIARASGGNASSLAGLTGNINSATKGVGRHDLAPGFNDLRTLATAESEAMQTNNNAARPTAAQYGSAHASAWESASLYQHANDKPQNIQAAIRHFEGELNNTDQSAAGVQRRQDAGVFFRELRAMQPSAVGAVRNDIEGALGRNTSVIDQPVFDEISGAPVYKRDRSGAVINNAAGQPIQETTRIQAAVDAQGSAVRLNESSERRIRSYERPDPNKINST